MSMRNPHVIDALMSLPFDLACATRASKMVSVLVRCPRPFQIFLIEVGESKVLPIHPMSGTGGYLISYTMREQASLYIRYESLMYLLTYETALNLSLLDEEDEL